MQKFGFNRETIDKQHLRPPVLWQLLKGKILTNNFVKYGILLSNNYMAKQLHQQTCCKQLHSKQVQVKHHVY